MNCNLARTKAHNNLFWCWVVERRARGLRRVWTVNSWLSARVYYVRFLTCQLYLYLHLRFTWHQTNCGGYICLGRFLFWESKFRLACVFYEWFEYYSTQLYGTHTLFYAKLLHIVDILLWYNWTLSVSSRIIVVQGLKGVSNVSLQFSGRRFLGIVANTMC